MLKEYVGLLGWNEQNLCLGAWCWWRWQVRVTGKSGHVSWSLVKGTKAHGHADFYINSCIFFVASPSSLVPGLFSDKFLKEFLQLQGSNRQGQDLIILFLVFNPGPTIKWIKCHKLPRSLNLVWSSSILGTLLLLPTGIEVLVSQVQYDN
jgi:hypothetical protein